MKRKPTGLRECRQHAGLSVSEVMFQIRSHVPEKLRPTTIQTIYRWEDGGYCPNTVVAKFLADLYGVEPVQIDPNLPDEIAEVRRILGEPNGKVRTGSFSTPPGNPAPTDRAVA